MSRFADVKATDSLKFPCECPDKPHEEDYILLRTDLGGPEWDQFSKGTLPALAVVISEWNFLDAKGEAVPISFDTLRALDTPTFKAIDGWVDEHLEFPTLPNASGDPSRNGSKGIASPTPKIPKKP